ncbi:hypothetical protein [Cryobacterium sp. TMT2-15-1]|uniref:hypothetical protein n=1 Tax=Cryobacterium sp. TMT2-15-1 TaxID=1259246 RepID=UPI00106A961F|nr:hypothetical protein [Cryobacterium sp. TMT2-15-1]
MSTHNSYKKRRELAVLSLETAPGVAATKKYTFGWLNKGLRSIPSIIENVSALGSDIMVNDSAIDVWHSEGPLGGKVTEDGFGLLANGMFNKITSISNGDSTYTHTLERDPSLPRKTFSFWDVRPANIRLFKSLYMDNLNLNIEVGDAGAWLECSTAFKGWKHQDIGSLTPPAYIAGEKEFTSRQVKLLIAANTAGLVNETTSKVRPRSVEFNFEESTTVDHYLGEVNDDPEFDSAPAVVKGSMVVKYRKTDFEDEYFTNAVHAMSFSAINGTSKIEVIGTKVRFREVTDSDGMDDTVIQTISFYFESDLANAGKDCVIKITNNLATFTV